VSGWLIGAIGVCYAYISACQFRAGNTAMGIAYGGYAFSQIGLWMVSSK